MGLFNLFSKKEKKTKPYGNDGINIFYDLLFADNVALIENSTDNKNEYPWNFILAESPDKEALKKITEDSNLETRPKIFSYNRLLKAGEKIEEKQLLGIIIEVGLENGLDVLAAYKDGTARYINHSEKIIVWEQATPQSTSLIEKLFSDGENVVKQIGPWDKERLPFPTKGMLRLSLLVSDGLYFGQGPIEVLFNDPMAAPLMETATKLMAYLTETAAKNEQ